MKSPEILARSHDGTIGSEEVSKLIQALDEKNFWNEVGLVGKESVSFMLRERTAQLGVFLFCFHRRLEVEIGYCN